MSHVLLPGESNKDLLQGWLRNGVVNDTHGLPNVSGVPKLGKLSVFSVEA